MNDEDPIELRLRAANRVPNGTARTELSRVALDEIGARIAAEARVPDPHRVRPKRPGYRAVPIARRGVLLASILGTLVVGASAATTVLLTTYTGKYNKGWEIKAGGPGELLLQGAPNACQAALKLSSDISYPSGDADWRYWVLVAELNHPRVSESACAASKAQRNEVVSSGAVRGFFAMSAFCAWTYEWRHAETAGNAGQVQRAATVIEGALRWPAVVAEDPNPRAGPLSQTAHGLAGDHSLFGWFIPFQAAVHGGNTTRVSELITSNYGTAGCSYFKPPANSEGGTLNPIAARQGKSS